MNNCILIRPNQDLILILWCLVFSIAKVMNFVWFINKLPGTLQKWIYVTTSLVQCKHIRNQILWFLIKISNLLPNFKIMSRLVPVLGKNVVTCKNIKLLLQNPNNTFLTTNIVTKLFIQDFLKQLLDIRDYIMKVIFLI